MSDNGKFNAVLSFSLDATRRLGKGLYSQDIFVILVRELFQNAVDACKRAGVDPNSNIVVNMWGDEDKKSLTVRMIDWGIGMTAHEMEHDLFEVGKRKNTDKPQVGGFGLAKLALFCSDSFYVWSKRNYVDEECVGETLEGLTGVPCPIDPDGFDKPPVTIVEATTVVDRNWRYDSIIRDAICMIVFSDYQPYVVVDFPHKEIETDWIADDEFIEHKMGIVDDTISTDQGHCFASISDAFDVMGYHLNGMRVISINGLPEHVMMVSWDLVMKCRNLLSLFESLKRSFPPGLMRS